MSGGDRTGVRPWGRCARCGTETHLDPSSALCPSCEEDRRRGPTAMPGAQPGGYPYPGPYPAPGQYAQSYPPAGQAAYPGQGQYGGPNPYANAYSYGYGYPYAYPYAYPPGFVAKPPGLAEAESSATIGIILSVIGLLIVFPFGFVSIVLGSIGAVLGYTALQKGARQGMWAIMLGVLVIALGAVMTALLFTTTWVW